MVDYGPGTATERAREADRRRSVLRRSHGPWVLSPHQMDISSPSCPPHLLSGCGATPSPMQRALAVRPRGCSPSYRMPGVIGNAMVTSDSEIREQSRGAKFIADASHRPAFVGLWSGFDADQGGELRHAPRLHALRSEERRVGR